MNAVFRLKPGISFVLASGSPRRREFIASWGIPFRVRPASAEPRSERLETPSSYAVRSSAAKLASAGWQSGELVIAADTIVAVGDMILGKPANDEDAFRMLKKLSGREHSVITAVSVRYPDGGGESFFDECQVSFYEWNDAVLRAYVATGECRDKAGSYAVQGQGAFLVSALAGSWSTVVGLPVSRLAAKLCAADWLIPVAES